MDEAGETVATVGEKIPEIPSETPTRRELGAIRRWKGKALPIPKEPICRRRQNGDWVSATPSESARFWGYPKPVGRLEVLELHLLLILYRESNEIKMGQRECLQTVYIWRDKRLTITGKKGCESSLDVDRGGLRWFDVVWQKSILRREN